MHLTPIAASFSSPVRSSAPDEDRAKSRRVWQVLVTGLLFCQVGAALGEQVQEPFQWSFVTGRYQLIGRHPDRSRTYSGKARIDRVGDQLRLTRDVGGKRSQFFGIVRRADPGEAYVLDFKWDKLHPKQMVCVIGNDLDNYARLTCHWGLAHNPHHQAGLEAYFAQEPWDPVRP